MRFTQQVGGGSNHRALTNTQSMLGTPLYMAPEQATGGDASVPIGPPADIWALGMLCFELLTGKTYFDWQTVLQFVGQLLFAELSPPSQKDPSLPAPFDAWFAKSCQRKPEERFASVGAQMADLAQALGCPTAGQSEVAPDALRQTIIDSRDQTELSAGAPASMPMPPPDGASEIGDVPTRLALGPEDPSLGNIPTMNAPKPQTLGDVPTLMKVSPQIKTIGSSPTQFQPVPPVIEAPAVATPAPPPKKRGRFWLATFAVALLALAFFLLPTLSSTRRTVNAIDMSAASSAAANSGSKSETKHDTKAAEASDLAVPRVDMAGSVETLVPISDSPPPRKNWKPSVPIKRGRPPDKPGVATPADKPKPPEEYVHPNL